MDNLLEAIVKSQAKCVIIDITGVEIVDTRTADYLLKVVQAAHLLGTRCVLTGINPAVAQTLVEIGADLSTVKTLRNLKAGLLDSIKFIKTGTPVKASER
jgi:rsbT co-antagonist protein RsbR